MGTNYYVVAESALGPTRLHVGKSSAGWTFSFQAHDELPDGSSIRCTEDWRKALDGRILLHLRVFVTGQNEGTAEDG